MSESSRLVIEAIVMVIALSAITTAALLAFVQKRRKAPDTIDNLVGSNDDLSRRVRSLERDRERDHEAILRMQTRLELHNTYSRALADYSRMLAERLRSLGQMDIPPAPTPPPELAEPLLPLSTLPQQPVIRDRALVQTIAALFNRDEIDDLAFRLDIKPEEIAGETVGKRARALVDHARRHGMTDELVSIARQLRPEGNI